MTITATRLVNGGYLVEGTDAKGVDGSCILHSERWDAYLHLLTHEVAQAEFDQVVKDFFQPITDAADRAKAKLAGPTQNWGTVTVGDTVEGKTPQVIELDNDGILLRLISEYQAGLRWVGSELVATQ